MILRRRPKPKPHIVVQAEWTISDPKGDARRAQIEVDEWAVRWTAPVLTAHETAHDAPQSQQ